MKDVAHGHSVQHFIPIGMMASPIQYWHTLRHLQPAQIVYRLLFHYWRPGLSLAATPPSRGERIFDVSPVERPIFMMGPNRFRFLNVEAECRSQRDWNDLNKDTLWLYNLHYFEDLVARNSGERASWHAAILSRWIQENPPTHGLGWEPYPTSLRIVNWIKWRSSGHASPYGFDRSLALQARWLRRRVEYHLLGNHLLANAKALILAGIYFHGSEADDWRKYGLRLLERELVRQVLEDGGHYERSPMYHALVLEDVLDLISAADGAPGFVPGRIASKWRDSASRMLGWLDSVTHPDGEIALFNDSAFGIAPTPADLRAYAERLRVRSSGSASAGISGYVRAERGPAVLIAEVADIGPDEQPGHAHADTLTFELSLYGERFIVDTGTSTYRNGPQRAFERSTAAHNTVEIDGRNSSEVWGSFRVARRARIRDVSVKQMAYGLKIQGSHDGYARLKGHPVHTRTWILHGSGLTITDRISANGLSSVGRFLLHPSVVPVGEQMFRLMSGRSCRWHVKGASAVVRPASWHPKFGVRHSTHCLHCYFEDNEATVQFKWEEK